MTLLRPARRLPLAVASATALAVAAQMAACGGGNALDNSPDVVNTPGGSSQSLSFVYFQECVNPMLVVQLALPAGGSGSCAASGCHDNANGTGGAFRMQASATLVDVASLGTDAARDAARLTEMYRNYFSAQGSSVVGTPASSKMLTKPLVQGVLHGGGQIFADANTPEARLLAYWISRPLPNEFNAADSMFTPSGNGARTCNTQ